MLIEAPLPQGATTSWIEIVVTEDGLYPFTLTYFEAAGGASLEFIAATDPNPADTFTFVSAINETDYIRAFAARNFEEPQQPIPSVDTLIPGDMAVDVDPATNVGVVLTDGEAALNTDSFVLSIDGSSVDLTVNQNGDQFILTHTPSSPFDSFSSHTAQFDYTYGDPAVAGSVSWSFTTGFNFVALNNDALEAFETPGSRFIEAEDFNATIDGVAGQWIPDGNGGADGMPYSGGAYQDLSATHDVDYHENDDVTDDGAQSYRIGEIPNVPMGGQSTGQNAFGFGQADRGSFSLTTNYTIGWGSGAEWRNYTRDFNAGTYDIYVAVSHGDPADSGQITGTVGWVTSDASLPDQTVETIGEFSGPRTGDWGTMAYYKLHAEGNPSFPAQATVAADGDYTVRFTWDLSGDTDFFVFVPAEPFVIEVPTVLSTTPADMAPGADPNTAVSVTLANAASALNPESFVLMLDGAAVEASVTQEGDNYTVTHTPASPFEWFTDHTAQLDYTHGDPAVAASVSWSFSTSLDLTANNQAAYDAFGTAGTRFIEAEDYNGTLDGVAGQWIPGGNGGPDGMPYEGGAYSSLSATHDVDYHENDVTPDGDTYRVGLEDPNVPLGDPAIGANALGFERASRGAFSVTSNYQIGWGGANEWRNYTRDFNAGTYEVYIGASNGSGTPDAGNVNGSIGLVTSDPSQPNQTVELLGEFQGPWSGDWGTMAFYKLGEVGNPGVPAQVTMPDGVSTVRFSWGDLPGDTDFFAFVPVGPVVEIPLVGISLDGGAVTITWDQGDLYYSPTVQGDYQLVDGASGGSYDATGSPGYYMAK